MAAVHQSLDHSCVQSHSTGHDSSVPESRRSTLASSDPRASFRRSFQRRFSNRVSTTEHHKAVDGDLNFYGPYAHIRKMLDYTYHTHYRKERQWVQDAIIEDFLSNLINADNDAMTTPDQPWLIYTVGAPGAGKLHSLMKLIEEGKLPLLSFVRVDPQEIRRRLPEFASFVQNAPDRVDKLMGQEAGHIMEILTRVALQAGKNVVLDGSLHDADWYSAFYQDLQSLYGKTNGLKVALLHISAPHELILKRAAEVAMWTHRHIKVERIDRVLEQIPVSIAKLKPQMDFYCELRNGPDHIEIVDEDWGHFRHVFKQNALTSGDETTEQKTEEALRAAFRVVKKASIFDKKTFVARISSEENYKAAPGEHGFYGAFSHIRASLDYTYHEHYNKKRQLLQDKIISDMLNSAVITDKDGNVCTTPTEPWIVFTAGAMGAGKSYTMNKLMEKGRFPLLAFVLVDPDEIRRHLPEFHIYVDEDPEMAGELTRKEAGFISEILTLAGLQAGKNVLVDGSLRDSNWYIEYFSRLKKEYPIVRQAILHVTAPREAVFQRAAARALTTGRVVPRQVLEDALDQVPRSVRVLGPLVDYFCELNNAPDAPDIEVLSEDQTWESFECQWIQTCAFVPNRRKFLSQSRATDEKLAFCGRKEQ